MVTTSPLREGFFLSCDETISTFFFTSRNQGTIENKVQLSKARTRVKIEQDRRSSEKQMKMSYENVLRPVLFSLDPEFTHMLSMWGIKLADALKVPRFFANRLFSLKHPCLHSTFGGISFPNPVGVAAGFDKNGFLIPAIEMLGIGFTEIGSVTALPSRGNPRPRLIRLTTSESIINRMGLNNNGADWIVNHVAKKKKFFNIPLVVSIAKTNDQKIKGKKAIRDYCYSFRRVYSIADMLTINISCPNTADGKTFETPRHLESLLSAIITTRDELQHEYQHQKNPPILVKIGANVSPYVLKKLIEISLDYGIRGFILTNTYPLAAEKTLRFGLLSGGLSGKPLLKKSTRLVRQAAEIIDGKALLIGVGGIMEPGDALKMFQNGAHLIQIYTGLIYKGPMLPRKINNVIVQTCQRENLRTFQEFRDFIQNIGSLEG